MAMGASMSPHPSCCKAGKAPPLEKGCILSLFSCVDCVCVNAEGFRKLEARASGTSPFSPRQLRKCGSPDEGRWYGGSGTY